MPTNERNLETLRELAAVGRLLRLQDEAEDLEEARQKTAQPKEGKTE